MMEFFKTVDIGLLTGWAAIAASTALAMVAAIVTIVLATADHLIRKAIRNARR